MVLETRAPFGAIEVLHSHPMVVPQEVRRERLRLLAKQRGVLTSNGTPSPTELGKIIGKKPNQTTSLLTGNARFGEKVARSIEEAAGLPTGWLDHVEADAGAWPLSEDLYTAVHRLDKTEMARLENVMRAHLGMPQLPGPPSLATVVRPSAQPLLHPPPHGSELHEPGPPYAATPRKRGADRA
jgi:hypothetical protein